MMLKSVVAVLTACVTLLATEAPLYSQGRGVPRGPAPQVPGQGRIPTIPPNAGLGRPAVVPEPGGVNAHAGSPADRGFPAMNDQLARSPRLAERLAFQLGVEALTTEPDGFRNLGQFVAAVQVANHVEGTRFEGIKARMVGDETTEPVSLGEAIQAETSFSAEEAALAATEADEAAQQLIEETN